MKVKHIGRITLFFLFLEPLFIDVNCSNPLNDSQAIVSDTMNYALVSDYLKANNLKICVLLSCNREDHQDNKLLNIFHDKSDQWYRFHDITNDAIEFGTLLMRLSHQIGVVIDLSCPEIGQFLREVSKRVLFHRERYWLMFAPDVNRTFDVLQKQNVNADAEISVVIPEEDGPRKNYRLYEAYNPSSLRAGLLNITQTGTWNSRDGFSVIVEKTKLENRRDFHGVTFKGVVSIPDTPNHEPFLHHLESVDLPHLNTVSRFNYRLFQIIQQMFNFKIFLQRTNSDGFLKNDRWQGAIGMINRQEVDVCISGFRWETDYYQAFEMTTNSYAIRPKFIFRHPRLVDASTVFTQPFKTIVWIYIVIVCMTFSYFLRHIFTAENHQRVKVYFGNQSINDDSWSNSILLVFGILFQQGYSTEPLMISSRILTLTVLVFSVLVSQFYSAFIVGSLLTEAPKTIKTMRQLVDSKLRCGIDNVPFILENFERSSEEPSVKLYERIMKTRDKNVLDLIDGLDLMKRGAFAFNTDASTSYLLIKKFLNDDEICDLQDVVFGRETPTGPIVPLKSPLTEWIKISIVRMAETGILAYHSKVWIGMRPPCPDRLVGFVPVDLLHFSTALYLVICGITLSFLILLAELAVHHFQVVRKGTHWKDVLRNRFSFGEFGDKSN